jgi:hypothetical protein
MLFGWAIVFGDAVLATLTGSRQPVAASAMAANSILRSTFAAAFPLFCVQMYNAMTPPYAGLLLALLLTVLGEYPSLCPSI